MRLSITTPKGSLLDAEVEEVTAPGTEGDFGVLPGHIPFLSSLRPGVLTYRTKDGEHVLAVSDGLLEVAQTPQGGQQVLVLATQGLRISSIDRDAAALEMAETDRQLSEWQGDLGAEYQALRLKRDWAEARVNAASRGSLAH